MDGGALGALIENNVKVRYEMNHNVHHLIFECRFLFFFFFKIIYKGSTRYMNGNDVIDALIALSPIPSRHFSRQFFFFSVIYLFSPHFSIK